MAQAPKKKETQRVIVLRPFNLPEYDLDGDVPVRIGMRTAAIAETLTLDRDLARDVVAAGKALKLSDKEDEAKKQIAEAKAIAKAYELELEKRAADAARLRADPLDAMRAEIPALVAAAVAQTIAQLGLVKPAA